MEGLGSQASPAPNLRDSLQIAMGDRTQFTWESRRARRLHGGFTEGFVYYQYSQPGAFVSVSLRKPGCQQGAHL